MSDLTDMLDQLDEAREKATPGEWAQHGADPTYVIGDISDGGESYLDVADAGAGGLPDAALIVAAVNALPDLIAAVRAGLALADELDEDSRDALKIGAAARDRGDREVHRISARHARVAHHAASQLRAALTAPLAEQHTTDEEADRG